MPFQIGCPKCNRTYTLSDDLRGKAIRCRDCSHAFQIPAATSAPAARQPAAAAAAGSSGGNATATATRPPAQRTSPAKRPAVIPQAPAQRMPTNKGQRSRKPLSNEMANENDVFGGTNPNPQFDPLSNHVVHNPGFAFVDPDKYRKQPKAEEQANSVYFNAAAQELIAKAEKEEGLAGPLHRKTWWPSIVAGPIVGVAAFVAFVSLLLGPIGILFIILAAVAAGAVGGIAEIWILVLVYRYDRDQFWLSFFIAFYRYDFIRRQWYRFKDVGTLLLISIAGGIAVAISIFLYAVINAQ